MGLAAAGGHDQDPAPARQSPGGQRRLLVWAQIDRTERGRWPESGQGPVGQRDTPPPEFGRQGVEHAGRRAPGTHARIPENAGNVGEIDTFGNALDQQRAAIEVQAGN